jgi:hypothetical protein
LIAANIDMLHVENGGPASYDMFDEDISGLVLTMQAGIPK